MRHAGIKSDGEGIKKDFLEEEGFELGLERRLGIQQEALGTGRKKGLVWSLGC
jgi:hypothetical protein